MPRPHSRLSIELLNSINKVSFSTFHELYKAHIQGQNKKSVYDTLFRLKKSGFLISTVKGFTLSEKGQELIRKETPVKDGVWKVIIYSIPEPKRKVRNFIRSRLQFLGFKKWQNGVWISPYKLSPEIEEELDQLAKKFFIRLIKTTDINYTKDLDKLFVE